MANRWGKARRWAVLTAELRLPKAGLISFAKSALIEGEYVVYVRETVRTNARLPAICHGSSISRWAAIFVGKGMRSIDCQPVRGADLSAGDTKAEDKWQAIKIERGRLCCKILARADWINCCHRSPSSAFDRPAGLVAGIQKWQHGRAHWFHCA